MIKQNASYVELRNELNSLLENLQQEDIDVDEAIKAYEQGMELVKRLEVKLKTAENKVIKLKTKFEQ
jgi:exodeoxyribonuclease VII small subunit